MSPGGGIRPFWRLDPIRLLIPFTWGGIFVYALMILFCVFVIYFTLREIGEIAVKGWSYWKSYWSWIEWFIIGTSVSAVGFYFYKTFITNKLLDVFSKTFGNGYMKLQHVALVDEFYGYHLGFLIFFANIKLLKINNSFRILSGSGLHPNLRPLINFSNSGKINAGNERERATSGKFYF